MDQIYINSNVINHSLDLRCLFIELFRSRTESSRSTFSNNPTIVHPGTLPDTRTD